MKPVDWPCTIRAGIWVFACLFVVDIGTAQDPVAPKSSPPSVSAQKKDSDRSIDPQTEDDPPAEDTEDSADVDEDMDAVAEGEERAETEPPSIPEAPDLAAISSQGGIWVDVEHKTVVAQGTVAFREGPLEMFACPQGTKEHESVVAVKCKAFEVHTALMAIGLVPGAPVKFQPEYVAATGPKVRVDLFWDHAGERKTSPAQAWVRNAKTGKALDQEWIFAGSRFWKDEETGESFYYAEGGELICLSNFSTATLDLPIASTQENTTLLFEAFTERIPELGTKVYVRLRPASE